MYRKRGCDEFCLTFYGVVNAFYNTGQGMTVSRVCICELSMNRERRFGNGESKDGMAAAFLTNIGKFCQCFS